MSTWWVDCKNMGKKLLPDGLDWLFYFAGNSNGYCEISVAWIFLKTIIWKMLWNVGKYFFWNSTTLKTYRDSTELGQMMSCNARVLLDYTKIIAIAINCRIIFSWQFLGNQCNTMQWVQINSEGFYFQMQFHSTRYSWNVHTYRVKIFLNLVKNAMA